VYWTYADIYSGEAGATAGACMRATPAGPGWYLLDFEVLNGWDPFVGPPGPIVVDEVFFAVTDSVFGLHRLNESLFDHPDLGWTPHPSFVLETGGTFSIPIGAIEESKTVLVHCRVAPDGVSTPPPSREFWQVRMVPLSPVEEASWGRIKAPYR
jgi:hypothetical protein